MRAAVCRAFGEPLVIEELELRAPSTGEVSVELAACAICHSDIAFMRGAWGGDLPAVYGHEAAGVVAEVGPAVDGVAPGDHVVVTLVRSCGRCAQCLRGLPALCESPPAHESPLRTSDGEPVHQGLRTAAFAERVTVDSSQVVPIPGDVPLEAASLLACGVLTGVGAVLNTARVEPGANVAVIGTGGVGLNVVQGAALAGAAAIVAIDLREDKIAAAAGFGATGDGARELDYVFVTAAAPEAIEQGMSLLRRGGTLVLIGIPPDGVTVQLDPLAIADRSLRILGSKMGDAVPQRDIPTFVELYRQGRLKLDELISGRWPLEQINEAVASAERGEALRPVIVFERAAA